MASKLQSVGNDNNVNTYAELYQEHLVRKHGQVVTTETQTLNVVGMVHVADDGIAYDTKREKANANRRYKRAKEKNKEQRHQNAVDSITRNANALKNRGFRITKQRK